MTALALDDRVGSRHLAPALEALGLPVSIQRLDFGDAAFLGHGPLGPVMVGLELKNLNDLLSSLRSGRLVGHQLPGMLVDYDHTWLLVEGQWRPNSTTGRLQVKQRAWVDLHVGRRGWMYREVDSFLTTLEVMLGVRVKRSGSSGETAAQIAGLYRWWQKDWTRHHGHEAYDTSRDGPLVELAPAPLVQRMAKELQGVGYQKARRVAQAFATPRVMASAPPGDWLKIEGIGKGLAARIDKELGA